MMQLVAIVCAVIGPTIATARPALPVTLNVSFGSSVDRTFFVDEDTDEIFTMRNQSRTALKDECSLLNPCQ